MPTLEVHYHQGGLHLPQLGLWLDAHHRVTGPDRVFVSHAHSDHTAAHREVILSAPTAKLMQARMGGQRIEHILEFGEPHEFQGAETSFHLTLLPAGHVLGSAMALIEARGESLLYTGDFKLRRGLSAEPCEPRHAEVLVMETTFGRPEYRFPPTEAVIAGVVRFCRETLAEGETAVLLGYSLGKSQELLSSLADAELPIALHNQVHKLTRVYEALGRKFPAYERYESGKTNGKVLICPPQVATAAWLGGVGPSRVALLTGWAVDPGCRFRSGAHAAFPLSDHADFDDLLRFVEQVAPRRVLTLHGFAADFARVLRERGYEAQALSEEEQLELRLGVLVDGRANRRGSSVMREAGSRMRLVGNQQPEVGTAVAEMPLARNCMPEAGFGRFTRACAAIASTSSKPEKIRRLADYLRQVPPERLARVVVWFSGQPFASVENKTLQVGWAALRTALCLVAGVHEDEVCRIYLRHSDAGETAADLWQRRPAQPSLLSLAEVAQFFDSAFAACGTTAEVPLLSAVLDRANADEARCLVKLITGDLRIGLKADLVEEAIAVAFGADAEAVRRANLLVGHLGEVADLARRKELARASLAPFRPVKLILGIEAKSDGIRCQLHKVGARVALFSRASKDITATFAGLADAARSLPCDLILDGEILAMRGEQVLSFAELQELLGRREGDLFLGEPIPVSLVALDLLWLDGESLLDAPLLTRRSRLEALSPLPLAIRLARITKTGSPDDPE